MGQFTVVASRLCQVRQLGQGLADGPPLDEHNFLSPAATVITDVRLAEAGVLADPAVLAQAGALILLGEPGIGKSTTLREIGSTDGEILQVDGADLTSDSFMDLVETPIEQFLQIRNTIDSGISATLTVIIDQVDECPMASRLGPRLRRILQSNGRDCVRLLVACRTADVPTSLVDALKQSFNDCQIADLAPLSYREAERLASSDPTIDGSQLLTRVIAAGAGVLASVPLTLGFLADEFRRTGDIVGSVAELFANGTTRLLDEPNADRRAELVSGLSQRKAVAGRLSALLLLSGRRTLWVGEALGAGAQDLDVSVACGGIDEADGHPFEVTSKVVRETRSSAIFTGRGERRIAFRHGSIAAYLNASVLVSSRVPVSQLKSLFLVPTGTNRYAIPRALQESAAWLIQLRPEHGEWIATADPESLTAYSKIVDSAPVRRTLVASLLARAAEIELGDRLRLMPSLDHPDLADQLRAVISSAGDFDGKWEHLARVRMAVQLARSAAVEGLQTELMTLLANVTWPAHIRQLAALAAIAADPATGSELKTYLMQFEDAQLAKELDPDQEIVGSLLKALWPSFLNVIEALKVIHPTLRSELLGVYRVFLMSFPTQLNVADLEAVLLWVDTKRLRPRRTPRSAGEDVSLGEDPIGEVDIELVAPLVDRYFEISSSPAGLVIVAALLDAQLTRYDSPILPLSLTRVDDNGEEDPASRPKRRALALQLLTLSPTFDRSHAWRIVWGWGSRARSYFSRDQEDAHWRAGERTALLDGADFRWAYELCTLAQANQQTERARRLATLAELIFPSHDREAFELVVHDKDHLVSQELRHIFNPVEINGPTADRLRRSHRYTSESHAPPDWPGRSVLEAQLRTSFDAALAGDTTSFWNLLRLLHFNPQTGQGDQGFCDNIDDLPGWSALPDRRPEELLDAALTFVSVSSDHGEEWLGTNTIDYRARAGYQALAALLRAGRIADVSPSSWAAWTAAIVWFWTIPLDCGDRKVKSDLLAMAGRHAAVGLTEALVHYARGELNRGQSPLEVEVVADTDIRLIHAAASGLLEEIVDAIGSWTSTGESSTQTDGIDRSLAAPSPDDVSRILLPETGEALDAAKRTFETLLERVLAHSSDVVDLIERVAAEDADSDVHHWLAVSALSLALSADARTWWPRVKQRISQSPSLSRSLCLKCAGNHDWKPSVQDLDDTAVIEVYQWIRAEFPPESDVNQMGVHSVGPDEQAQHWRRHVLSHLAQRGTIESLHALEKLANQFPDDLSIGAATENARSSVAEVSWLPPSPHDIAMLLSNSRRRLVRTDAELASVIVEVLRDVEIDLPGHCQLLWDGSKSPTVGDHRASTRWRPKLEASLCAYITHELRLRLGTLDVLVNREVMVRPTDEFGAGERTDILVQATSRTTEAGARPITVVIEVKGSWNVRIADSQRTQLAQRYLPDVGSKSGIYLVGWFELDQWNDTTDHKRAAAAKLNRSQLEAELRAQADEIRTDLAVQTIPVILQVTRPIPTTSVNVSA